jgi:hypothetical protein
MGINDGKWCLVVRLRVSVSLVVTILFAGTAVAPAFGASPGPLGEKVSGISIAELRADSEVLASPSASPSDDGKLLVTWFGDQGESCFYNNTQGTAALPHCIPLAKVVDVDSDTESEPFALGGGSAPWYYGAPYASWNPVNKEWVAYWTSYGRDEETSEKSGLSLRRVSSAGQTLGVVVATPTTAVEDGVLVRDTLSAPSNPSLLWLPGREEWVLLGYFDNSRLAGQAVGGASLIAFLRLDSELRLLTTDWQVIDLQATRNNGTGAYGVAGAVAPNDFVGVSYRNLTGDLVFKSLDFSSGAIPFMVGPTTLVLRADATQHGNGFTFDSDRARFIATYNVTSRILGAVTITVGPSPSVARTTLVDFDDLSDADFSYDVLKRSWAAYSSETGKLHIAQHVETASDTVAMHMVVTAADLSVESFQHLGEEVARVDNPNLMRTAGRPVISQTGSNIAFAYSSWDKGWQNDTGKVYILADFVTRVQFEPIQSVPAPYLGPVLTSASPQTVASGDEVLISGRNLASVTRVAIDGLVAQELGVSESSLRFRVPNVSPGLKDVMVTSSFGVLTVQDLLSVVSGRAPEATVWTRASLDDNSAKVYARGVVGAGKVRFVVNGREVAWVRAIDSSDPKLRVPSTGPMAGVSYLVRTVPLVAGKNVIEIYVEGERVRRVAYTR